MDETTNTTATTPAAEAPPPFLRGFAPLALGVLLVALIVLLAPSIAPEHIVSVPAGGATTTTTTAPAEPTTTAVP